MTIWFSITSTSNEVNLSSIYQFLIQNALASFWLKIGRRPRTGFSYQDLDSYNMNHIEKIEISKMHLTSFTRINFWSSNTTYNESIESLLGNSFLPALSKDRRRPLKIRQIYTMNKALCEFNENLVDKTTGDLNTDNVATYINQLGSGRRIKSQNERDINYYTIFTLVEAL